jgi:hypothetical protein
MATAVFLFILISDNFVKFFKGLLIKDQNISIFKNKKFLLKSIYET